ncbi:unnamed protein product, partial [Rotaria magnacalcarata]
MLKDQPQNVTTVKRDLMPPENETNYLTSTDMDSTPRLNETTKRVNNANGKFSIQKMIRQGFSSWRTRKKPPSVSSSTPTTLSTNISIPSSPPASSGRYVTTDIDLSQVNPSVTNMRSLSTDLTANQTPPQRIIVTEQIPASSIRSNSVDSATVNFDGSTRNVRGYIQSPWAKSAALTSNIQESTSRQESTSSSRILPMQTTDNTKFVASGYVSSMLETTNSTMPSAMPSSNSSKIPPPVAPKPDINRVTPIRSNYFNNNLSSASSANTTSFTPGISNTPEQRHIAFSDKLISNQFTPISDSTNDTNIMYANFSASAALLKDRFQAQNSPVNTRNSSSPTTIPTSINEKQISTTTTSNVSSSPSTNSSSTAIIQTAKQITVQDIDTTKYEEIPPKEPDLSRQPEKSALKKPNGLKRRVIPVFRENQRPSPRPSP